MPTATPRRLARFAAPALISAWAGLHAGCCQPCYAPVQPGCPPLAATQPAVVRYGEVCETPAAGSSAVAQAAPLKSVPMAAAPRPRVVVSEPSGRLAGRSGWRRPDPESATLVEGALDDDVIRR